MSICYKYENEEKRGTVFNEMFFKIHIFIQNITLEFIVHDFTTIGEAVIGVTLN